MGNSRYYFRLRGRPFQKWLRRNNLSQNELARGCGLSAPFISQLLSGERNAGPNTRKKIMAAFPKMDFDNIFEEIQETHE